MKKTVGIGTSNNLLKFYSDEEVALMPETSPNATPPTIEILNTNEETRAKNKALRRAQIRPIWMQDYEVTGIDEDEITYFSLFSYCDPINFETVMKKAK